MTAALLAGERRRAHGVDPSAMWAVVADPSRLETWAPLREVAGTGSLLSAGDRFAAELHLWPWRGPCDVRVAEYEAGRRFRLECRAAAAESVWVECRVESVVEPSGAVAELRLRLDAPDLAWPARTLSAALGTRRLRKAARSLVAAARSRS